MNIHEYQAKELLRQYKVATPDGRVAVDAEDARQITKEFGGQSVVKAQIHAGGRGKGGGVKFAKNPDEAAELFKKMLGMTLVTHQTGAEGRKVHTVFISNPVDIEKELYLAFLVDRGSSRVTVMASTEGGVEIEEPASRPGRWPSRSASAATRSRRASPSCRTSSASSWRRTAPWWRSTPSSSPSRAR